MCAQQSNTGNAADSRRAQQRLPPLDIDLLSLMDTDANGIVHVSTELAVACHYQHLHDFQVKISKIIESESDVTRVLFEIGAMCDSLRSRHRFLGLQENTNKEMSGKSRSRSPPSRLHRCKKNVDGHRPESEKES